ncbi:hypothetical protein M011DRAFT_332162 [Sporormia fimetaria CBS 119925]|uniref:Uncharacterized protein n=1 Tax=Sporormia fimetaria CBS 119925 TaxID=1340428 RepID=A0A6A6VFN1_9PLEO|nr:hypothetical protein M011DRAFT_332162 [Sporormia fimetaria CBS 119925]
MWAPKNREQFCRSARQRFRQRGSRCLRPCTPPGAKSGLCCPVLVTAPTPDAWLIGGVGTVRRMRRAVSRIRGVAASRSSCHVLVFATGRIEHETDVSWGRTGYGVDREADFSPANGVATRRIW